MLLWVLFVHPISHALDAGDHHQHSQQLGIALECPFCSPVILEVAIVVQPQSASVDAPPAPPLRQGAGGPSLLLSRERSPPRLVA